MATNNEEIIERKEGSPVATSCLIIACVAIVGAISLQIAELTQVRASWSPTERADNKVLHVKKEQGDIIDGINEVLDGSKPLSDATHQKLKTLGEKAAKTIDDAAKEAEPSSDGSSAEAEDDATDSELAPEEPDEPTDPAPAEKDSSSDDSVEEDF